MPANLPHIDGFDRELGQHPYLHRVDVAEMTLKAINRHLRPGVLAGKSGRLRLPRPRPADELNGPLASSPTHLISRTALLLAKRIQLYFVVCRAGLCRNAPHGA